jgi:hypothetical protein
VEQCIPALHKAITCLRAVKPAPDQPVPELRAELNALRFELGVMSRLVLGAAEFNQGWAKALAATAAECAGVGYTAAGDPTPLSAPRSLSVRG